jgi:hypothetical protein
LGYSHAANNLTSCGNDYYYHKVDIAVLYANIYQHLGMIDKAIAALLKEGLNEESTKHLKMLKPLLENYDKAVLRKELNNAINNYSLDTNQGLYTYNNYSITFLNTQIKFYYSEDNENPNQLPSGKNAVIAHLKKSVLYKVIMTL